MSLKAIHDREEMQSNIEKKISRASGTLKKEKKKIDYSLVSLLSGHRGDAGLSERRAV